MLHSESQFEGSFNKAILIANYTAPLATPIVERDPCFPSPCGPNSQCRNQNGSPSCSCLSTYIGTPPNCRPECTIHQECPSTRACVHEKCVDPCPGSCGPNAVCHVTNHIPICSCFDGYIGNPFTSCQPAPPPAADPQPIPDPCNPSPCARNALCRNGQCTCQPGLIGDPYTSCRPECVLSTECPRQQACIRNKCADPCPGTCGTGAICEVQNHIAMCSCPPGQQGNAFAECRPVRDEPVQPAAPCQPSPCGPNSQCRPHNGQAVCSCVAGYIGTPPTCRPECVNSQECSLNLACLNQKCRDPCIGTCGINARCTVVNHNPICSCPSHYDGNPFARCMPIVEHTPPEPVNPCHPSPCGPNALCRPNSEAPACSCLPEFIGSPPACRPECVSNSECPNNRACIRNKCADPCPGVCGHNTQCHVISHTPNCVCAAGLEGNAQIECHAPVAQARPNDPTTPCVPSPCGSNAICREQNGAGACQCLPEHTGNPYDSCRPECLLSSDCPSNRACVNSKCIDPCAGACAPNAQCQAVYHRASCSCWPGYEGDPYRRCSVIVIAADPPPTPPPCSPSPCGPNAQCRENNGQAICSCLPNYYGAPPACRPECTTSAECPSTRACVNLKCVDPCPGVCGQNARCHVQNHNVYCTCENAYIGNPFVRCTPPPVQDVPEPARNPCVPSPCGPYSQCQPAGPAGLQPSCSCLPNYFGAAPNCRPECTINAQCPGNLACMNERCRDPCPGACGALATCHVNQHAPICTCQPGYVGDPFTACRLPPPPPQQPLAADPCNPSPCGTNAQCTGAGICACIPQYHGDPYTYCRPECVNNADCPRDKACSQNRCIDPCPGACGREAICEVYAHVPMCGCPRGMEGNAFVQCDPIRAPPQIVSESRPCYPSPCGPNAQCRVYNEQAVCSCLPGFFGSAPACRPECVVASDCLPTQTCLNQRCVDPCAGYCGANARCYVTSHQPRCECTAGFTGNALALSGCRPIGECRNALWRMMRYKLRSCLTILSSLHLNSSRSATHTK